MMPPMAEWLGRCQAAREQGEPIPLPALFRRMLEHSEWYCREGVGEAEDFFVAGHLTPDASECVDGLRLAAALNPTLPTMNLHHAAGMPPLVLDRPELDHFRSFLGISVVEALLTRMQDGADLEVDEPFAKLRAFDGFLTVCAGVPGAGEPSPHSAAPSMRLALAPDVGGEGRKLAAAFTAEDALQHFIAARDGAQADDGLVAVRMSGCELFEKVVSVAGLDGIVFNASGPSRPVALTIDAARHVLTG